MRGRGIDFDVYRGDADETRAFQPGKTTCSILFYSEAWHGTAKRCVWEISVGQCIQGHVTSEVVRIMKFSCLVFLDIPFMVLTAPLDDGLLLPMG